jgi:hypothetical protein
MQIDEERKQRIRVLIVDRLKLSPGFHRSREDARQ